MKISIKRKRIKNIYFRVEEDGTISVSAPYEVDNQTIFSLIEERKSKLLKISERKKKDFVNYMSANTIPFLGKTIKLRKKQANREKVVFENDTLTVFSKNISEKNIKKSVEQWYGLKLSEIITPLIEKYSYLIGKKPQIIRIKKMKTRWGSCNSKKRYLNFNLNLIKKPLFCIEYVVAHELTHLIHNNHGKDFYNTLSALFPKWKEAKETLSEKYSSENNVKI